MGGPRRLLVVSNRAPVQMKTGPRGPQFERTVGGLATALDDALRERGGTWIAWVGTHADEVVTPAASGLPYPIHAVRLKEREIHNYYAGFANQVLWPLCHMFITRCSFQPAFWSAYRQANERFAAAVQGEARPGDLVWVHDFHLCLVPGFLRATETGMRVGVFWHIPFPPPSIFGICRWREDLLGGLLGADLIGFQTEADVRNFLDSVAQYLDLRIADDPPRVCLPEREVQVAALPIGIDAARFRAQVREPAVRDEAARLRKTLSAEVMLIGVDRLDYTKGILERLRGFERFLERQPEWRRRVSLLNITVPSRFRVPDYREMKREIDEIVGRITGRFTHEGRSPIAYSYTALDHEQLSAYYLAADIALVTPVRDGMNLVAKEYVACHAEDDGVLILSEFAGAAQELREAALVNPYDPEAIRRQIELALSMPPEERRRRMAALTQRVATQDIRWWTSTFLELLAGVGSGVAPRPEAAPSRLQ